MKQVTAILIGAGQRGAQAYAGYALRFPAEIKFVAVAEPRNDRREEFCALHGIVPENSYENFEELLGHEKLADCAVICTQDRMHCVPTELALAKGYHVLLEKPMSPDRDEIVRIGEAAKKSGRSLSVCHILRYSPFFSRVKELLNSGAIGEVISIQHIESVGFWHAAHSFVRGNWRDSRETSPMILAKCCHDIDILLWLTGSRCSAVSSFGSLRHFRAENAPEGAPARCTDGCAHRDECPYYAPRFYLEHPRAKVDNFVNVLTMDDSPEGIMAALAVSGYGRCVYRCDNDVVDNQVVNMQCANGVTIGMTMSAFTEKCEREINIMGSHGQLRGNMDDGIIELSNFATSAHTVINLHTTQAGHNGSDTVLMRDFVRLVASDGAGVNKTAVDASVESHLVALAAEQSRVNGGEVIRM